MKTFYFFSGLCLVLFFISTTNLAQDINVHDYIGKKPSNVIKKYGKPVHHDDSNPSMQCMFYKSSSGSMIFVSNEAGIYQAESSTSYSKEREARSVIDSFISGSVSEGYSVDTLSTSEFDLKKPGVKVNLQVIENKSSQKFDIRVKANRSVL
jgi:hypothetical protein